MSTGSPSTFRLAATPRRSRVALKLLEDRAQIGRRGAFAAVAAGEGEIGLDHALHLVDVPAHLRRFTRVAHEREREFEARDDGAQIMRDAVEHGRALLDRALDAPLHLQKGGAGLPHLARAARAELTSRPFPNSSAARARRTIGRIWLRRKEVAMARMMTEAIAIHMKKI